MIKGILSLLPPGMTCFRGKDVTLCEGILNENV